MQQGRRVLVTGATGFIGTLLTRELIQRGWRVRMAGRSRSTQLEVQGADWFPLPDLREDVDWRPALEGVQAVVHLAVLPHEVDGKEQWDPALYDRVNHRATRSLAEAIRDKSQIERFVNMSSAAVHGEPDIFPIRADSMLDPRGPYAKSKLDAERAVQETLVGSRVRWVTLRPVVVYGPGNPRNMARLEGLIRRGIPIPVGRRPNRRSFLFAGNLIDAVLTYLEHEEVPTERSWMVADPDLCSTEELLRAMGEAMGVHVKIMRLSDGLLNTITIGGDFMKLLKLPSPWNSDVRRKLLGDYHVDTDTIKKELNWKPPYDLVKGIAMTYGN